MNDSGSFLSRFGGILLDGLEVGGALALQQEFTVADDRVFTNASGSAVPRGVPAAPAQMSVQRDASGFLLLAGLGFLAFKTLT